MKTLIVNEKYNGKKLNKFLQDAFPTLSNGMFFKTLRKKDIKVNGKRVNKDIDLLDSPGILWPKLENQEEAHILAAFSAIKEEILNIDAIACFIIKTLHRLYPEKLENRYGITELDDDLIEAYDTIAMKRGALSRGGVADYEKVSNIIIRDLKNNYFGNLTFDRLK